MVGKALQRVSGITPPHYIPSLARRASFKWQAKPYNGSQVSRLLTTSLHKLSERPLNGRQSLTTGLRYHAPRFHLPKDITSEISPLRGQTSMWIKASPLTSLSVCNSPPTLLYVNPECMTTYSHIQCFHLPIRWKLRQSPQDDLLFMLESIIKPES